MKYHEHWFQLFLMIFDKFLEEFGQFLKYVAHTLKDVDRNVFKFLKIFGLKSRRSCAKSIFEITFSQSRFSPQITVYYRVVTFWTF